MPPDQQVRIYKSFFGNELIKSWNFFEDFLAKSYRRVHNTCSLHFQRRCKHDFKTEVYILSLGDKSGTLWKLQQNINRMLKLFQTLRV